VGGRPAVEPPRKWRQIQDERLRKTAWWRLLAGGLFLGFLGWLFFPSSTSALWVWAAWACYFGFCFLLWSRNARRKLQLEKLGRRV
jgi:hypothetical protein